MGLMLDSSYIRSGAGASLHLQTRHVDKLNTEFVGNLAWSARVMRASDAVC
jgi:hypothetical protein